MAGCLLTTGHSGFDGARLEPCAIKIGSSGSARSFWIINDHRNPSFDYDNKFSCRFIGYD